MWKLAQLALGLLGIAAILAFLALCLYVIWWAVMIVVSYVPILGKRHRHDRWDELNAIPQTRRPNDEAR